MGRNLPALQETWVLSLGGEDPLQKGMAIPNSFEDGIETSRNWATSPFLTSYDWPQDTMTLVGMSFSIC